MNFVNSNNTKQLSVKKPKKRKYNNFIDAHVSCYKKKIAEYENILLG